MIDTDPVKGASTPDRIIEATLRLMTERGLGGVTMKAIAETAGVARQTLYNHFGDVESIVAQAIEAHRIESLAALRGVLATIEYPLARLEHLVRHSAAGAVHHHPFVGIQHSLSASVQATLLRHDSEVLSIIEDALKAGIAGGDLRADVDVKRDAHLMKRMLDAVAELVSTNPEEVQDAVAAATRTLLASVTARGAGTS